MNRVKHTQPELTASIVTPTQASPLKAFGIDMRVLLPTDATAGATSVLLTWHGPGEGPPYHVHLTREEIFFVVQGVYEVTVGARTERVGPGTLVFIPRTVVHRFRNVGLETACMLDWSVPGGQDHFFTAVAELDADGDLTSENLLRLSQKFDTTILSGSPILPGAR